ncbi:MAG: hypothetical protein AAF443_08215 [Chlamydiota bacterium]
MSSILMTNLVNSPIVSLIGIHQSMCPKHNYDQDGTLTYKNGNSIKYFKNLTNVQKSAKLKPEEYLGELANDPFIKQNGIQILHVSEEDIRAIDYTKFLMQRGRLDIATAPEQQLIVIKAAIVNQSQGAASFLIKCKVHALKQNDLFYKSLIPAICRCVVGILGGIGLDMLMASSSFKAAAATAGANAPAVFYIFALIAIAYVGYKISCIVHDKIETYQIKENIKSSFEYSNEKEIEAAHTYYIKKLSNCGTNHTKIDKLKEIMSPFSERKAELARIIKKKNPNEYQ